METTLLEHLYIVNNLSFHYCYHPKLISIWVLLAQELVTSWDSSWLLHELLMLLALVLELFGDKSVKRSYVFDSVILLSNQLFGSSFPIGLIILVMFSQYHEV